MNNTNFCCFVGNLTRDPELKQTANGNNVVQFSIAVNESYGDTEHTNFFDVTAFGKLADVINQYKKKGDKVLVIGRAKQGRWEDSDGKKKSRIEFIAQSVEFLNAGKNADTDQTTPEVQSDSAPVSNDDIPF